MSDIAIRFDGLLLGLVMLSGVLLFAAITLGSAVAAMIAAPPRERRWNLTILSAILGASQVVGLGALIVFLGLLPTRAGPDWIDWLALPWCGLICIGSVALFRARAPPR